MNVKHATMDSKHMFRIYSDTTSKCQMFVRTLIIVIACENADSRKAFDSRLFVDMSKGHFNFRGLHSEQLLSSN